MPETVVYRIVCLFPAFLLFIACGAGSPEPAQTEADMPAAVAETPLPGAGMVVFKGAAIWDGTGGATKFNQHLLVKDGRIVGYSEEVPDGADIVDVGGNWIVPGFVNAHGHITGNWAPDDITDPTEKVIGDLALYARYGVTSVISLGGEPPEAFALRAMNSDPSISHARLRLAGEVAVGDTPQEAAAIALANIAKGVDWIKLRVDDNLGTGEKMPWDAVQVVINAAKAAEIPVATHIFYMDDAARLLAMGSGLIAHSVRDRAITDDFVQAMLDTAVCYVPTLTREVSTFVYASRPAWFDDPFFLEAAKQSEIDRVSQPDFMARMAASPSAAAYKLALIQAQDNLRVILGSGVPVAFGTDSGPGGRFPGYFEHMEFELMAEAGMTPREILLSATSVAANCVHLDDVGTLEAGNWADFIVLTQDPTRDIKATRSIKSVYIAGKEIAR